MLFSCEQERVRGLQKANAGLEEKLSASAASAAELKEKSLHFNELKVHNLLSIFFWYLSC